MCDSFAAIHALFRAARFKRSPQCGWVWNDEIQTASAGGLWGAYVVWGGVVWCGVVRWWCGVVSRRVVLCGVV